MFFHVSVVCLFCVLMRNTVDHEHLVTFSIGQETVVSICPSAGSKKLIISQCDVMIMPYQCSWSCKYQRASGTCYYPAKHSTSEEHTQFITFSLCLGFFNISLAFIHYAHCPTAWLYRAFCSLIPDHIKHWLKSTKRTHFCSHKLVVAVCICDPTPAECNTYPHWVWRHIPLCRCH